jgi:tetratricopeptide (TPR) repeat protein
MIPFRRFAPILAAFLLLCLPALATAQATDAPTLAKQAREETRKGNHEAALAVWQRILDEHPRHELVADGSAHWAASRSLRHLGKPTEAAELLESYLKKHPKGKGTFAACVGIFLSWLEAGDDKRAQKAGKVVFHRWPDAPDTFMVLRPWVERGYSVPRLKTSYRVLYDWTFDRISGARDPELRLAFLEIIETQHRKEDFVKDGGVLYCKAWAHIEAGRPEEGLALGEKHLKLYPKDVNRDKFRVLMARAYLAFSPPEIERARKLLRAVVANPKTRYRKQAEELLGVEPKDKSIQIEKGFPKAEGIGKVVLLTNLPSGHALRKAATEWRKARDAEVVQFRGSDVKAAASGLRGRGAEFVAVLVKPETIDNNFHLSMLELCRSLDRDPMPDFHFGYLTARDADDLEKMLTRLLAKEAEGGTVAKMVPLPNSAAQIEGLDFLFHIGHGTERRIVGGLDATRVSALSLTRGPVIVSGACFNGICSRSFASSIHDFTFHAPRDIDPKEVLSLAWIHAGATGLIAALDGDRGEMAMAEWEILRERAPALGEVTGWTYRSIFMSLPDDYAAFPRYQAGQPRNISFFHVMMRGWASRILISDPSYRPLKRPLTTPTTGTTVKASGKQVVVTVRVTRFASGPFINVLPRVAGTPFREKRLYARVALPEGFKGRLGRPKIELSGKAAGAKLSRKHFRHEVWGGRRYVNVQLESLSGKLVTTGATATLTFPKR